MKLSDIKDGMVVETRESNRYLKINNRLYNRNMKTYIDLDNYDKENLTMYDKEDEYLDIIKVYKVCNDCTGLKDIFDDECLINVWKREEPFKKSDFKNGMIVKCRNDKLRMYIDGYFFGLNTEFEGYLNIENFSENLLIKSMSDFDIVEVYDINVWNVSKLGKLLWKRDE